jgi:hypothetical protein
LLPIADTTLQHYSNLFICPFQLANINIKFSAVIAVVASLSMLDATPVLDRPVSQRDFEAISALLAKVNKIPTDAITPSKKDLK